MTRYLPDFPSDAAVASEPVVQPLDGSDGLGVSVHVFSRDEVAAVNTALAANRPLLVRGEPGTGKTQLGRAAAAALGRGLAYQAVDALTDTHDLLWTTDLVSRLAEAQIARAADPCGCEDVRDRLALSRFVQPGVLWWALDPVGAYHQAERGGQGSCTAPRGEPGFTGGIVALVDEIDKADPAVPNALLDALGHGGFNVPTLPRVTTASDRMPPLVVLTTNEERALPDAFLRRCVVLYLSLPDPPALHAHLVLRGRRHFPEVAPTLLAAAARMLEEDRAAVRARGLTPPGLAEFLDLVRAVKDRPDPEARLHACRPFTLRKHPLPASGGGEFPEPRR